jgi:hypothetical protein
MGVLVRPSEDFWHRSKHSGNAIQLHNVTAKLRPGRATSRTQFMPFSPFVGYRVCARPGGTPLRSPLHGKASTHIPKPRLAMGGT